MEFTDKTEGSIAEACQLARDHANVQGMSPLFFFSAKTYNTVLVFPVYPVHLAFVLLNGETSERSMPGGATSNASPGLFASVVSRVGGDPVSIPYSSPIR